MKQLILLLVLLLTARCGSAPAWSQPACLKTARQMVLVTSADWNTSQGRLQRYERKPGGSWQAVGADWAITLGRNGMAWDDSMASPGSGSLKHEGDGRSPAGAFGLPRLFGKPRYARQHYPFIKLSPESVGVDDPRSRYYNQILDRSTVKPDWDSAEKMWISIYDLGVVVDYNLSQPRPGRGSCIFIHSWDSVTGEATAGCTAMKSDNLHELCGWMRADHQPVLVQLPRPVYQLLQPGWGLPRLAD